MSNCKNCAIFFLSCKVKFDDFRQLLLIYVKQMFPQAGISFAMRRWAGGSVKIVQDSLRPKKNPEVGQIYPFNYCQAKASLF